MSARPESEGMLGTTLQSRTEQTIMSWPVDYWSILPSGNLVFKGAKDTDLGACAEDMWVGGK